MRETKAKKSTALLLVVALISVATVASVGIVQRRIRSEGTVYVKVLGVEVYWDPECTSVVTEIDWGVLEPSDAVSKTIYVKNTGNTAVTLSMTTENWTPAEACNHITMTWDAEGSTLKTGANMPVNITLNVSSSIKGISDFSLDIVITGGG